MLAQFFIPHSSFLIFSMGFAIFLLLLTVLGAGRGGGRVPAARGGQWLKPLLAFSGAYLFTLTITHILPEALQLLPGHAERVGYWVLAGFFGKLLLEVLSQGIEHGTCTTKAAPGRHDAAGRVPFSCWGHWWCIPSWRAAFWCTPRPWAR